MKQPLSRITEAFVPEAGKHALGSAVDSLKHVRTLPAWVNAREERIAQLDQREPEPPAKEQL